MHLMERIQDRISADTWSQIAEGLQVSISCGVACSKESDGLNSLLTRTDGVLYRAKPAGRDQVYAA